LRRLENEALRSIYGGQKLFNLDNLIKVGINQFYGIEINDFAVTVAKTALWIAESQMMHETEEIIEHDLDFLPLKSYANIIEGNSLRIEWESVVPKEKLSYIMGNPPFVGYSLQNKEQKSDILSIYVDEKGKPYKTAGKIDYVSGWYFKASEFMTGTDIKTAFVSTNSITQGEQVASVWKPLYDRFKIHIDFAYRTFRWDSEATLKAHVHCVIVGFSVVENFGDRKLYDSDKFQLVKNISPYLLPSENIFIESRKKPLCDVPAIHRGNQPTDGGNLIINKEDYEDFIKSEPKAKKYIKRFMMGYEFINNVPRYCLWLVGVSPKELKEMPLVMKRIQAVKKMRESSTFEQTRKMAETPYKFREEFNPDTFVAIPVVSSENRKYIPMGYLDKNVIAGNK
ncbi:MAG: methylase, partial [Ruminococcus sp.]|nr:methylase [Ruminococcus sp.]